MPSFDAHYILDASALLALLQRETGHEIVAQHLDDAYLHALNLAEVIGKLVHRGIPADEAAGMIEDLGLPVDEDVSVAQAREIGALLSATRHLGLSLGDAVCLIISRSNGSVALTADRQWAKIPGDMRIEVIR